MPAPLHGQEPPPLVSDLLSQLVFRLQLRPKAFDLINAATMNLGIVVATCENLLQERGAESGHERKAPVRDVVCVA
mgnify:FL=1